MIEREMTKEDARQEKIFKAAEALENGDFDQVIDLTSDILYDYRLEGPVSAEILAMRGLAYFKKGDMIKAKGDVDKAISENKQEARAYLIRSSIHEQENRLEKAIPDMESYVRLKPNDQEGLTRLQELKNLTGAGLPASTQPDISTKPQPVPDGSGINISSTTNPVQKGTNAANQQEVDPGLKFVEAPNKSYALHKPADWVVQEDMRPDSMRVTVLAPEKNAAVDFLWVRNQSGQINALQALAAYQQRLVPSGAKIVWTDVYRSPDNSKARVTMQYQANNLSLKGTFYLEASTKSLSVQGYMALDSQFAELRPLLYNIMASLALSKQPTPAPPKVESFNPQYVSIPLVNRQAQDGSLMMSTPNDWGFMAAQGKVITSAADGSIGFAFLAFSGNPLLQDATVAQGIIAQPYMAPAQTIQIILAGFGHRNISVHDSQSDPKTSQEFSQQVGRLGDAQDMRVLWISNQGASCQGFFKVINAQPSPNGLWFCLLAGIWGPDHEFYRYYPLLEQVASSFSINDQFARQYIHDGLIRARELHDQTIAAMQANANEREKQQVGWENRQKQQDFVDSKWDDYWRGNGYWVSDMENGKVYQTDNYGTIDTGTGDYYEGSRFNWTNFDGRNPRHPSETMQEVTRQEMEQILGQY